MIALPSDWTPLVLASASPRRRDLLASAGLRPEVAPSDVDESLFPGEDAFAACERLARDKARAAAAPRRRGVVLAGDTIVVLDGEALGKPADRAEAAAMLRRLAGRTHQVASSAALLHVASGQLVSGVDVSDVEFSPLDDARLERYLAGDEWRDKAGAYAIQGEAGDFARLVSGRLDTVIGLSLGLVERLVPRLVAELVA
ncbi:MAG: septum formation protein Maf [Planctomycetes bacterium]|nr:septum formation protein Maf [Planctomycetota bacterium]